MTVDLQGAYLQSDYPADQECYIKFEGVMARMICEIDPKYEKYVLRDKKTNKRFLYGRVSKAIYGTLLGMRCF